MAHYKVILSTTGAVLAILFLLNLCTTLVTESLKRDYCYWTGLRLAESRLGQSPQLHRVRLHPGEVERFADAYGLRDMFGRVRLYPC